VSEFWFQSRIPFADKKFALKSLYGVMQSPNNLPCTKGRALAFVIFYAARSRKPLSPIWNSPATTSHI